MPNETGTLNEGEQQEQTFTQADVDAAVRKIAAKIRADEREKFADYDDLKAKAEGAKSAEERLADLERKLAEADAREKRAALVQSVATKHGITDAEDVALFLTGQDEDTLTAQAKRLADRDAARRKAGDISPGEGKEPRRPNGDSDMREFANRLFGRE